MDQMRFRPWISFYESASCLDATAILRHFDGGRDSAMPCAWGQLAKRRSRRLQFQDDRGAARLQIDCRGAAILIAKDGGAHA